MQKRMSSLLSSFLGRPFTTEWVVELILEIMYVFFFFSRHCYSIDIYAVDTDGIRHKAMLIHIVTICSTEITL